MGKAADLTAVHKTPADAFHREGQPQKVVAGRTGCLQCAESKHIQGKLTGREKGSASTRNDRSPGRTVNQSKFKKKLSIKSHLTKTCPGNRLLVLHS